ncbi:peptidyl-prolyl cis-trans isomerase FKBP11 isoform X2 [Dama dama]|uniref:peptidyl-prolyl cis-trans isomerase FKBP11 isoform X2 n=1 Tax=Dama dama TaxID=30532 RepID=UPI002A35CB71|nr:peptidyl-prolyl cis-trans isomerase FKBP11 isoform X2 [Dama dama]
MLDVTQPLTVGLNERLTDRSESHPRDLRGPGERPWPPPSRRWGLGGGRAAGGGAGASRPAPSHPVWPGRRRNCGPSPCHPAACPACPEPCPHPVMTLRPSLLPLRVLLLLLLRGAVCRAEAGSETESPVRTLQVETLVEPPEPCAEPAAFGDTLHIHYSVWSRAF